MEWKSDLPPSFALSFSHSEFVFFLFFLHQAQAWQHRDGGRMVEKDKKEKKQTEEKNKRAAAPVTPYTGDATSASAT